MFSVTFTGAGSGSGRACALRLAADGFSVTVNDLVPAAVLCSDEPSLFFRPTIGPDSGDVML